jgi:cytochrome P450
VPVTNTVATDLADPVMFSDPYPRYHELRRTNPVSRAYSKQLLGGAGYMLTRHEHVLLLHNDVRFSSDPTSGGSSFLMRDLPKMFRLLMSSMVYKDDPDHARLRRLVNKAFTPRMVQQLTGEIQRIVPQLLDAAQRRGSETVDLVHEVATPLPLSVISSMLGVGDADRDEFHVLVERFVVRLGSGTAVAALRAVPAGRKLYTVLERLAEQCRLAPDDGLISGLLAANEDGDTLSNDEVSDDLPAHARRPRYDGESHRELCPRADRTPRPSGATWAEPDLTPTAVEELLRFTSPVPAGAARMLLDDVEIEGTAMPKGSKVLGMIISANRDEAVFDRPDELDLGRDPNRHLTFAFGKHFCLGNQLARLEGQIAIGELVRRFPNMRLAVPRDDLVYKPVQSLRGFRNLPPTLQ